MGHNKLCSIGEVKDNISENIILNLNSLLYSSQRQKAFLKYGSKTTLTTVLSRSIVKTYYLNPVRFYSVYISSMKTVTQKRTGNIVKRYIERVIW